MNDEHHNAKSMPSLLEEIGAEESAPAKKPAREPRDSSEFIERLSRFAKPLGIAMAVLGLTSGAVIAYQSWGPVIPPKPMTDPLDDVLGFTFLDADFNRLPLEKRIELAKQIAERLRAMSAQDSVLMASFAAGIAGKAREQLEENMTVLMVDLVDSYAKKYAATPEDQKEKVLRESLVELLALQSELDPAGVISDAPPEERLDRWKRGAERRADARAADASTNIQRNRAEDILARVESDVNERTNPAERARTVRFMRDTVRYLRGNDLQTGKPKRD